MTLDEAIWLDENHFHNKKSNRAQIAHIIGRSTLKPLLSVVPLKFPGVFLLSGLDIFARVIPSSKDLNITEIRRNHWRAHYMTPKNKVSEKIVIYFHGGAFISCGLETHGRFVEKIAVKNGVNALNVDYRQFPKGNVTDSFNDCMESVKWAIEQGFEPENIYLMGDSAGAGLAVRAGGTLKEEEIAVAGVVSISGWLNYDHTDKIASRWKKYDAYIPASRLEDLAKLVIGGVPKEEDHPINYINAGFPNLLILCGAKEVLRCDSQAAADRAIKNNVDVELHYFSGGVHAFPVMGDFFPESILAFSLISSLLNQKVEL